MQPNATAIIALRGWHPAIARAEAKAMFANSVIARTDSRRLLIATDESDWEKAELMSGCECVLVDGGMSKWTSLEDLLQQIESEKVDDMAIECSCNSCN